MSDNKQILEILNSTKKILLIEPNYSRASRQKYMPLGLAKISSYIKNKGGEVQFSNNYKDIKQDVTCITSMFTYESDVVLDTIASSKGTLLVGGIYATLMPEHIKSSIRTKGKDMLIFNGVSEELDLTPPDYSIKYNDDEFWGKCSYVITTRGCPNSCAYCAVRKIEPNLWINTNWKNHINMDRKVIVFEDNNLTSQKRSHVEDVFNFTIINKKTAIFNNGFDCKYLDDDLIKLMGKMKWGDSGLRIAFDRIEEDGIFQEKVSKLLKNGVSKSSIMAFILFNFNDKPKDAVYRMEECVKLGIRPYPAQYTPLNITSRKERFTGKFWSDPLKKAFRHFCLMGGLYRKNKFIDWARSPANTKFKLETSDLKLLEK